jgi:hypothetical protein
VDYGLYASVAVSWDDPGFPLRSIGGDAVGTHYETGVTFGTRDPWKIRGVRVPRIGLGYRFGESGLSVLRFVIGIPSPALRR